MVPRAPATLSTSYYAPATPIPPPLFKPCRWQRRTSDTASSGRPCAPRGRRSSARPRHVEYGASTGAVGGAGPPAVSAVGGGEEGTREGGSWSGGAAISSISQAFGLIRTPKSATTWFFVNSFITTAWTASFQSLMFCIIGPKT